MKNSIIPSYTKNTSCLENILCIILQAENADAENQMLFIDHWRMNYDENVEDLGDRIKFFDSEMIENLFRNFENYYGMKCHRNISADQFDYTRLFRLWDQFDYLIMCIDAFELKNLALYKKWHVPHYILITSVKTNGLCALDYAEEIFLDIDHYNRGGLHFIGVMSGSTMRPRELWINDLKERIASNHLKKDVFNNIRRFAAQLSNTEKVYKELNNMPKEDVLLLRLPNSLTAIGASRYLFNLTVQYICDNSPVSLLAHDELHNISISWFEQIKKIIKFKFSNKESILMDVQKNIERLADKEESLAAQFLSIL